MFGVLDFRLAVILVVLVLAVIVGLILVTGWIDSRQPGEPDEEDRP